MYLGHGPGIFTMVVAWEALERKEKTLLDSRVEPLWTLDAVIAIMQQRRENGREALLCTKLLSE